LIDRVLDVACGGRVIRTVWFAAFCLAGLGGVFATTVTASMSPTEPQVSAAAVHDDSGSVDTLATVDRDGIAYRQPLAARAPDLVTASIAPGSGASASPKRLAHSKARPRVKVAKTGTAAGAARAAVASRGCVASENANGRALAFAAAPPCG
jgi:hypothetical protein